MTASLRHLALMLCRIVLAVALTAGLAACANGHDDEPVANNPGGPVYEFGLYVTAGDNPSFASSLTPNGTYDPASSYENYIDLVNRDYRIYLFDSNNKLIWAVEPDSVSLLPTANSTTIGSKTYELRFPIHNIKNLGLNPQNCTFKLLMLANWGSYPASLALYPGVTTIDDIMESSHAYRKYNAALTELDDDHLIPMFGVNQFANKVLDHDLVTNVGKLHLLRSLAKVEVLDASESGAEIASAKITRHSTRIWKGPKLPYYLQSDYVHGAYTTDYGASFRPWIQDPSIAESSTAIDMAKDPVSGSWFIYIPEYRNVLSTSPNTPRPDAERARILLTYKDGRSDYLDFKYYDSTNAANNGAAQGDFFDIRRNYWYRYTVDKRSVVMIIRVDQVPYVSVELNPTLGWDDPLAKPPSEWVVPPWVEIEQ